MTTSTWLDVFDKLIGMRCHSTDISDAFDAADPF